MEIFLTLVLLIFVFILGRAILKAKVRMRYADEKSATREMAANYVAGGVTARPSWFADKDKMEMFEFSTTKLAIRNGIPGTYIGAMFAQQDVRDNLLSLAANMEKRGSSFAEQQLGVYNFIAQMWAALGTVHKEQFIALSR